METLLLNAEETARLLGLGRTKVYEMLAGGALPVVRVGRSVRVPRDALREWIRCQTAAADSPLTAGLDSGVLTVRVRGQEGCDDATWQR